MELIITQVRIIITNQGWAIAGFCADWDSLGIRLINAITFRFHEDRLLGFMEKATHLGIDAKDFYRAYCGEVQVPKEAIQCVLRPMTEAAANDWDKILK